QHEVAIQIGSVEDKNDRIGLGHAGHGAAQHVHGDAVLFRFWREAIYAGQVNEGNFLAVEIANVSEMMFDGDAGEVCYFLAKPCEAVEEGGLAGVRRTDDGGGTNPTGGLRG